MKARLSACALAVALMFGGVTIVGTIGCKDDKEDEKKKEKKERRKKKRLLKKTSEAIDNLDKIYKSATMYYSNPIVARGTGMKLDCQFPANQGMTPDVRNKACCGGPLDTDGDNRCDVNSGSWSTNTWSSLNFQMNDQHYFGYAFESSGVLGNARFTARAHADLDCDGKLSTFERFGYGEASAASADCTMKASGEIKTTDELE